MIERWKDIEGYEDLYQISNTGKVRSLDRYIKIGQNRRIKKGQIIKVPIKKGYYQVRLSKNGKRKSFNVHRLVAKAFIPNPNNLPQVNHKDENKLNNNMQNLEWCNALYNNIYGTRIERVRNKTGKKIIQYDLNGNFIQEFNSLSDIKRKLNYNMTSISNCCKNRTKKSHGYIWKFKSEVMPNANNRE